MEKIEESSMMAISVLKLTAAVAMGGGRSRVSIACFLFNLNYCTK
jgi:uncharacterized protein YaaN involved in tellurite resistance